MSDDVRKNLMQNQDGVAALPENDGSPKPLADTTNNLRFVTTEGKSPQSKTKAVESHAKGVGESNASAEYYD